MTIVRKKVPSDELRAHPGVGPSIARDLRALGCQRVADLRGPGIDSVVLCAKPLRDYGECVWYDPPLDSMPAAFPVVICDGPPGTVKGGGLASCRSWRTG